MKRLREWLESIVFAGMTPSGAPKPTVVAPQTWAGRQRARIDKWISGGPAPTDPLYLTNRSWGQKIKTWSVVAVPLLILIGGVALTLSSLMSPPDTKPTAEMTSAEVAAKILPNLKNLKIDSNRSLDVLELSIVERGGTRLVGVVKNLTNHEIASADISCDLTDAGGTQLGAVTVTVENIPPSSTKPFEMELKQTATAFALVREISTK
jgi:hypothetical protein